MTTVDHWLRPESSLMLFTASLSKDAECAAYREALKNVMRSQPKHRFKIADEALFGKNTRQRGRSMLKVVKAAVQVWWFSTKGSDKDFLKALKCLNVAMQHFEMKGATVKKWIKKKDLKHA